MKLLRQLLVLFRPAEKLTLCFFLLLNVSCSFLELIGIGAVIPFILLLTNPDSVNSNRYMKMLYDWVAPESFRSFVFTIAIAFIIFFILKNLYMALVFVAQQFFLRRKYVEMTDKLLTSYLFKPYPYFFNHSSAELLRNVQSMETVVIGMLTPMLNFASEVITIAILAGFVVYINPQQALLLGGGLGVCVFAGLKLLKKKTYQLGRERLEINENIIRNVMQGVGSIKETRILGNEQAILAGNHIEAKRLGFFFAINNLLGVLPRFYIETLAIFGIMLFLLLMLQAGYREERVIVELSVFGMVALRLMPSITRISVAISNIRTYIPSFNFVYNDVVAAREINLPSEGSPEKMPFADRIELRHIVFSYNKDRRILDDVSLEIRKNQRVGFVGPSGSGKTTVVDLIIGLLEPAAGQVLVDGKDIRENLRGWQANIGYIPQKIFIFNDTVRANIALGIPADKVDEQSVLRALEAAQLTAFISRLPEGLDTVVGENGIKLSGGELQRLGIARALYRDPEVLVMDEATSALDNETEKEFMASIDALGGKKTIILIAHRLTTVEKCDTIYRVENGGIRDENHNRPMEQ